MIWNMAVGQVFQYLNSLNGLYKFSNGPTKKRVKDTEREREQNRMQSKKKHFDGWSVGSGVGNMPH